MNSSKVIHVFFQWSAAGGVEVILQEHRRFRDETVVGTRETYGCDNLVAGLGMRGWMPLCVLQRRFEQIVPAGSVVIYHNGHCASLFAGVDRASARLIMLHGHQDGLGKHYAPVKGSFHGALVVSSHLLEDAELDFAGILRNFRFPVDLPRGLGGYIPSPIPDPGNKELRLGYIGRVVKETKRLDRLPELAALLNSQGTRCEINLFGGGDFRHELPDQVGRVKILKHGYLDREELAKAIVSLDATFSLTDSEGFGLNVVDSLAAGVPVFFPDLKTDAARHVRDVAEWMIYPVGDMETLAKSIRQFNFLNSAERNRLRGKSLRTVAGRTLGTYFSQFDNAIKIATMNSDVMNPSKHPFLRWLPLKLVWKMLPIA